MEWEVRERDPHPQQEQSEKDHRRQGKEVFKCLERHFHVIKRKGSRSKQATVSVIALYLMLRSSETINSP